ncbi:NAD(P)H-flavin reductase [Vibrio campbellii]|uniref:flavin mononucleotide reductase LuxG n=1 Tax=Vibrio sp. LB10LO1 TaxID=2711207 RepID=UPI001389A072|nr:NAD(P)H-flavin reductase [Vibrio sp. LB10LO1]NDJ83541.1 NAD(P)H-flavin reductase [Vibrio sp. LB10LO1]
MLCSIEKIEPLTGFIFRVLLKPDQPFEFRAGQYINVSLSFGSLPFSIASCPSNGAFLELHIGGSDISKKNTLVMEELTNSWVCGNMVEVSEARGDAWLRDESVKPLLLVAGGTGMSYTLSILKNSLEQGFTQPIYVYWGAKDMDNLYVHDELVDIALENKNVSYVPVTEISTCPQYAKQGKVLECVMSDFRNLSEFDIYLCGPCKMVEVARDWFCDKRGAEPEQLYADAFAYL